MADYENRRQKIRNTILALYKENPEIVNDDTLLLERVWLALGWDENRSLYDNLSRLPRPESITRRRRELFNEGLIVYSEKADKDRIEAFKNEREAQSKAVSWLND